MDIIHALIYQPIFNLLFLLYTYLGNNLGIAIIVLGIIVKVAMTPIMNSQKKMAQKQKDISKQLNELKIKYKDDPQTLLKEQMKLQGGIGSSLGGCLMLIITIILFLQIRGVILDLTNQGWHAFNKVAYIESWKQGETNLTFPVSDLSAGKHKISFDITSNEYTYKQDVYFWVYSNNDEKTKFEKEASDAFSSNSSNVGQFNNSSGVVKFNSVEGNHRMSAYSPNFTSNFVVNSGLKDLNFYFRYPFEINKLDIKLKIDDKEIQNLAYSKGKLVNLNFFGIDLGTTALEAAPNSNLLGNITNPSVLPYIALALILGISQYFGIKYLSPTKSTDIVESKNIIEGEVIEEKAELAKTKDEKKKQKLQKDIQNKEKNETSQAEDMAKTMEDMSASMSWMFASLSVITSLGMLGGAQFFPAGLSIYWTSQSIFDIIKGKFGSKLASSISLVLKKEKNS